MGSIPTSFHHCHTFHWRIQGMITCPTCRREFKSPKSIGSHSKKCRIPVDALFWMKVDKSAGPDACWPFRRLDKLGYGRFDRKGPLVFAHRCAWIFTNGEIPADLEVAHHCDNRACCNPSHLFLATHHENMLDAKAKDRHARGERNSNASIMEDDVVAMRASYTGKRGDITRIAEEWELPYSLVRAVIRNASWKHLPLTEEEPAFIWRFGAMSWTCKNCGHLNHPRNDRCVACLKLREPQNDLTKE